MHSVVGWKKVLSCVSVILGLGVVSGGRVAGEGLPVAMPEDMFPELAELLESALDQAPQVIAAQLEVERARANYIAARAPLLPRLSGSLSYAERQNRRGDIADAPTTTSDGLSYSLGFSQPIFYWGALKWQAETSKLEILFSEVNVAEAYRLLAQSIRNQYLAIVYQNIYVRNLDFTLKIAQEYEALQQSKFEAGTLSAGAIIEPKLRTQEAQLLLEENRESLRFAAESLARVCGVVGLDLANLSPDIPAQTFLPPVVGQYIAVISEKAEVEATPQVVASDLRIRQDILRYRVARTRLLPLLSASANYSNTVESNFDGNIVTQPEVMSTSYGLSVSWSIFDGFASRGERLAYLASRRVNERARQTLLETTKVRFESLERQIEHATQRSILAQQRFDLARDAVRLTQQNFEAGVASRNAVEGVTLNAYQAELVLASARRSELTLWSEYISTAGLDPVLDRLPNWKTLKVNAR